MRGGESPRRNTRIAQRLPDVAEEIEAEINDSKVESEEMRDDVISDDKDWGDENEVALKIEEDKKRRKERV